jgi:hypothetical protein
MDNPQIYAIGYGALLGCIILLPYLHRFLLSIWPWVLHIPPLPRTVNFTSVFVSQHLTRRAFLRRRRYINPWSRSDTLLLGIYFGINLVCLFLRFPGASQMGLRAGTLALLNTTLFYAGPHLSFLTDILGMSLDNYRRLHLANGLVSFVLALFHAIIGRASRKELPLNVASNLFALVVRYSPSHLQ